MYPLTMAVAVLLIPLVMCYDPKFDKVDVDKIIADETLFNNYINCLLDKGPCDGIEYAEEYKKLLPEVVATACANCSPVQKSSMRKSVKALQQKKPEDFQEFRKIYDPKGEHEKDFAAFVLGSD